MKSRRPALAAGPLRIDPIRAVWIVLVTLGLGLGCASDSPPPPAAPAEGYGHPSVDVEVYRRAETERAARLAQEVERLRADLGQAEEALVMAESGLRDTHTRADAVSSLAETRIQVERAAAAAPWRTHDLDEAWAKLDEAKHQIDAGHFGAAFFFVYRAARIASQIEAEAALVVKRPDTRFIRGRRVNVRVGPSTDESILVVLPSGTPVFPERTQSEWILVRTTAGAVGWVYGTFLGE